MALGHFVPNKSLFSETVCKMSRSAPGSYPLAARGTPPLPPHLSVLTTRRVSRPKFSGGKNPHQQRNSELDKKLFHIFSHGILQFSEPAWPLANSILTTLRRRQTSDCHSHDDDAEARRSSCRKWSRWTKPSSSDFFFHFFSVLWLYPSSTIY